MIVAYALGLLAYSSRKPNCRLDLQGGESGVIKFRDDALPRLRRFHCFT